MRAALDAAASTGGLFDPTVLGAMEAVGYDRTFDDVLAGARGALRPTSPCGRWRDVVLKEISFDCRPAWVWISEAWSRGGPRIKRRHEPSMRDFLGCSSTRVAT